MAETQTKLLLFVLGIASVATLIMLVGITDSSNNDMDTFDDMQIEDSNEFTYEQADETPEYEMIVQGTRDDVPKFMGVDNCKVCHDGGLGGDQYEGWSETGHGKDFTPSSGIRPAINTYDLNGPDYPGSCAFCHAVGVGNTENGGFDMNERWDSNTPTADQEVGNVKLIGIQCESCHGPGSEHSGEEGINGNPSVEESCYADGDSLCHGPLGHDKYTVWKASAHSNQDQLDTEAAGGSPRGMNSQCARCKSPSQYNPDATDQSEEFTAAEWHGIGCADCHDPHSDEFEHQLRTEVEDACTICHTSEATEPNPGHVPHHVQKEAYAGVLGIGISGQKGMAGVTCVDCHMWETPEVSHGYYMSDAIDIEMHEAHGFEATAQACADCHSSLMADMPAHGRPANNTGENEELWNEWNAWGTEWNETVEMWEMVIHDWQENYEHLLENVEHNYAAAEQALTDAQANGNKSPETIAEAQALLDDAIWNIGMTDDGSSGVHNPDFFTDLLNKANVDSNMALKMLTTNGAPIANAGPSKLVDTGTQTTFDGSASSDMDGTIASYSWNFGDGSANGTTVVATHTYSAKGTYLVTLTVTDNTGAMDKDMITVFVVTPPPPVDLTDIETDISDIQDDVADIKADIADLKTGGGDDNQTKANTQDIEDLDSKISSRSGMLGAGIVVVLLIALGLGYHGMETVKQEIKKLKP